MARRSHALQIAKDLVRYAMQNKKWWLIPVLVVTTLMVVLVVLGSTPLAPLIYTVF